MGKSNRPGKPPTSRRDKETGAVKRHPAFGALKDSTFIPPGVDLTEPADPDWGKVYEKDAPVPDEQSAQDE